MISHANASISLFSRENRELEQKLHGLERRAVSWTGNVNFLSYDVMSSLY